MHQKTQEISTSLQIVCFKIGNEEYGIDILRVQEIRSFEEPTRIANSLPFIKGVVNLRGVIVPVVDLRIKLGCALVEYNSFTVVIVLNVKGRVVGAVVDSVSDVLAMVVGFLLAARLPVWLTVAIALGFEIVAAVVIRDGLVLNVLMLIWPLDGVRVWQQGL